MKYLLLITLFLPVIGFCQDHDGIYSNSNGTALLPANKKVYRGNLNKTFTDEIKGKPLAYYINHPNIDSNSKAFYSGYLSVSDDTTTFALMDSLLTDNNDTRPFYVYNFCRIMELSDGALSEGLTDYAVDYILKFPCEYLDDKFMQTYRSEPANWEAAIEFLLEPDELPVFLNKVVAKVERNCPTLSPAWQKTKESIFNNLDIKE